MSMPSELASWMVEAAEKYFPSRNDPGFDDCYRNQRIGLARLIASAYAVESEKVERLKEAAKYAITTNDWKPGRGTRRGDLRDAIAAFDAPSSRGGPEDAKEKNK